MKYLNTLKLKATTIINWIRHGSFRDLPVVNSTCIRGVYDPNSLHKVKRRKTVYVLKEDNDWKTYICKKFRNIT